MYPEVDTEISKIRRKKRKIYLHVSFEKISLLFAKHMERMESPRFIQWTEIFLALKYVLAHKSVVCNTSSVYLKP